MMDKISNIAKIAAGNAALSLKKAMAIILARPLFFLVLITIQLILVGQSICSFPAI
ncbi:MAG: hypothetical protein V3V43_02490 [Dehalococcoidales bacterium]